jgi:hypothetical protein
MELADATFFHVSPVVVAEQGVESNAQGLSGGGEEIQTCHVYVRRRP